MIDPKSIEKLKNQIDIVNIIEQYIHYLIDQRLVAIGLKRKYNVAHPIKWVDDFAKFNDQKSNFFEAKVTNYSKGSISFDDF